MKRLLVVLFLVGACRTKPEVPKDVIQPDKMQAVIYDLIQVDGMVANTPMSDSILIRNNARYLKYQQVLSLHGFSKDKFIHSLKFYEANPFLFKIILDSMEKKAAVPPPVYTKDSTSRRPLPL